MDVQWVHSSNEIITKLITFGLDIRRSTWSTWFMVFAKRTRFGHMNEGVHRSESRLSLPIEELHVQNIEAVHHDNTHRHRLGNRATRIEDANSPKRVRHYCHL